MTEFFALVLLLGAGVARFSYMIAHEDGAFYAFSYLRFEADRAGGWVSDGIHCPYCVSVWLSGLAAVAYAMHDPSLWAFLLFFGVLELSFFMIGAMKILTGVK